MSEDRDARIMQIAQQKSWAEFIRLDETKFIVRGKKLMRVCTCAGQNWARTKRCYCTQSELEARISVR